MENYFKTKEGVISRLYYSQKQTSTRRGHLLPEYSKNELIRWAISQEIFNDIYNEWVNSGYKTDLKPSIDRIDDSIGYSLKNIRLTTWFDNRSKSYNDTRLGILKHGNNPQKKVAQLTMDGLLLETFPSLNEASRSTGVHQGNISSCCNGKRKNAGGYKWLIIDKSLNK